MKIRNVAGGLLATGLSVAAGVAIVTAPGSTQPSNLGGQYAGMRNVAAAQITEDDPRWDCATMGNRICGPVKLTAVHHARHLPRWFDWTYASRATTREVCGKHQPRAIVVWARNLDNDNSMVVCANGKFSDAS